MLSAQQFVTIIAAGLLAATLNASIVRADTACKGLIADQCGNQSGCLWVKGYTRKDGRAVQGYCRNKGAKAMDMTETGISADRANPAGKDTSRTQTSASAAKVKEGG